MNLHVHKSGYWVHGFQMLSYSVFLLSNVLSHSGNAFPNSSLHTGVCEPQVKIHHSLGALKIIF